MTPAHNDGEIDEGVLKSGESVVHIHEVLHSVLQVRSRRRLHMSAI